MGMSRKSFIRWIIAGGAVSACPMGAGAAGGAKPEAEPAPKPDLHSESNTVCHQVRDGDALPMPAPRERVDIAVIGAGPSGLAAADRVQDKDFLLLEKEDHVGGNCYPESWNGLNFSTGAAWASIFSPEVARLFKLWKFEPDLKEIRGLDAAFYDGHWVPEFWNGKAGHPNHKLLGAKAGKAVDDFCRDLEKVDFEKDKESLDQRPFSELLKGRHEVLTQFWDGFGLSNWGAPAALTSAYVGIEAAKAWAKDARYTFEGGLGIGARKIYEHLSPAAKKRVRTGAPVYHVERRKRGGAVVRYMKDGQAHAVAAKSVVMAGPKYIAKHLVTGIPDEQRKAMGEMRYAPYIVVNLCFDRVVYNQAYDNWVIGAKNFTDFIPADFVTHADGGDLNRPQVLTVYCPKLEGVRPELMDDGKTRDLAQAAADELFALFPSWRKHLVEGRVFRRGHPMFMSIPGLYTRLQPAAAKDLAPVFFAHSDTASEISDLAYAAMNGIAAAEKALKFLAR
ncbi:MAG TPA: FAD-dependent oxidoreductase [Elusimicrobiota bacterium]|jgi:phytoene dehydrogenase-like protein|nr:FAD-dependent oxidoreductase [Elusimicrobiota bacterium]